MSTIAELVKVAATTEAWMRAGRRGIAVTIAGTRGSTYRRSGARLLIAEDGEVFGAISGGCVERDLAERVNQWLARFEPCVHTYDTTRSDDIVFGLGLGCRGVLEMIVEPFDATHPPRLLLVPEVHSRTGASPKRLDDPFTIATTVSDPGGSKRPGDPIVVSAAVDRTQRLTIDGVDVLVEVVPAQRALILFGGGPDVAPVVTLARSLGWWVDVAAPREHHPDQASKEFALDRYDAAVVMTHNFLHDLTLLRQLVSTRTRYVGILGPKARTHDLLATVDGFSMASVHAPVGLDLGGETPEEIALAIVAEIQAVLNAKDGGFLRDRDRPIHETAEDRTSCV